MRTHALCLVSLLALLTLSCEGASSSRASDESDATNDAANGAAPASPPCARVVPRQCSVRFSYPQGTEHACDLRGSFDGWGVGVPMQPAGGQWVAHLDLLHGQRVAYKFVLDGARWVRDPANLAVSTDGDGNSLRTIVCPEICGGGGSGDGGSGDGGSDGGNGGGNGGAPTAGAGGGDPGRPPGDATVAAGGSSGDDAGPGPTGGVPVPPPPLDCPAPPPVGDFRDETIYFLMTTRFFDGDASNNYYNRDRIELGDPTWRGDFKGLIAQLDYIHETLGFTALWITPVVENRSGLDYHGYHGYDFTRVDPRLESRRHVSGSDL